MAQSVILTDWATTLFLCSSRLEVTQYDRGTGAAPAARDEITEAADIGKRKRARMISGLAEFGKLQLVATAMRRAPGIAPGAFRAWLIQFDQGTG